MSAPLPVFWHSFCVQMSEQWRLEQDKMMVEIIRHREADLSYIEEGVRLKRRKETTERAKLMKRGWRS